MGKNLWDKSSSMVYIKVGSFFLMAILLFFVTILSMPKVNIFESTYIIIVKFRFAEGLRRSSPVRFCGVDAGQIKKVIVKEEDGQPLVYVYAKIKRDINIPKDSFFFINSLSLFGEKYLEINPTSVVTTYLNNGDVIEGVSPIPLFNVFSIFTKTMGEISEFVKEGKIKTSLENTLVNMEDASLGIKSLIEDMRNKRGTVGRLLYDDSLYEVTEEFIADIKAHPWKLLHKPK